MAPLICPDCLAAYDIGGDPPGYRFPCRCGRELKVPEVEAPAPPEPELPAGAFWSLVLACLFPIPFVPALGIVLAVFHAVRIVRSPRLRGLGVCAAAIFVGALSLWIETVLFAGTDLLPTG